MMVTSFLHLVVISYLLVIAGALVDGTIINGFSVFAVNVASDKSDETGPQTQSKPASDGVKPPDVVISPVSQHYREEVRPGCAVVCAKYRSLEADSFYISTYRDSACKLGCSCVTADLCVIDTSVDDMIKWVRSLASHISIAMSNTQIRNVLPKEIDTKSIWEDSKSLMDAVFLLYPAFMMVVIQVMALYKFNPLWRLIIFVTMLPSAYMVGRVYFVSTVFTGLYSSITTSPNTPAERGVIGLLAGMVVCISMTFAFGFPFDMLTLVVLVVAMGYFIKMAYTPKVHLSDLAAALNLFFVVVMLYASVHFATIYGRFDTIGYRTIFFMISSIGPINIEGGMLTTGAIYATMDMLRTYRTYFDDATLTMLIIPVVCLRIFIFLTIRSVLSYRTMRAYHGLFNSKVAVFSLVVYFTDIFNPIKLLFVGTDWMRTVMNLVVEIGMLICEIIFAQDVFLVRLVLSIVELVFDFTNTANLRRFLVDERIMLASFPVPGSLPWFDSDAFAKIRESVVRLDIPGSISACGIILRDRSNAVLATVAHVAMWDATEIAPICKATTLELDGTVRGTYDLMALGNGKPISRGADPVLLQPLRDCPIGVQLPVMAPNERAYLKTLFVVNPSGAAAVVTDFKFDKDELGVVVNLKHGDSGSPVIGVLGNGGFRYVGAVSAGSITYGRPNMVSVVNLTPREHSPGADHIPETCTLAPKAALSLHAMMEEYLKLPKSQPSQPVPVQRRFEGKRGTQRAKIKAVCDVVFDPSSVEGIMSDLDKGVIRAFNFARATQRA